MPPDSLTPYRDRPLYLRLHQLLHNPAKRLAQEIQTLALEQVADDLLARHPLPLGHRGDSPLVSPWQEPTSLSAAVAGPSTRLRPTRSYTTLRDVTAATQLLLEALFDIRTTLRDIREALTDGEEDDEATDL